MGSAPLERNAVRTIAILFTGILIFHVPVFSARGSPRESNHNGAASPKDETLSRGEANQDREKPTVILVVGAAGTEEYGAQFAEWAGLWKKSCSKGDAQFIAIGLDISPRPAAGVPRPLAGAKAPAEAGVAEVDDITTLQEKLAAESKRTDAALWLVLIGHGTYDGKTAKFNLRGPDLSADDLAEWLKPFSRPIAVINTASSSAPFLSKLSRQGRVVITATKSGFEQNYARFGQYLAGAIAEPQADLDKDGQTSLLEAFLTASHRVDEFYSAAGRLATERALLDDNGDGLGTRADWFRGIRPVRRAMDDAPLDGYVAHQFHLVRSEAENKMPSGLRAKRDQLELEVIKLRDAKERFSGEEYFSKLEALLYDIAQIYEQTDKPHEIK